LVHNSGPERDRAINETDSERGQNLLSGTLKIEKPQKCPFYCF
jgi:hypothetical protein